MLRKYFPSVSERRPLKAGQPTIALFRSPSARLVQQDKLLLEDSYRGGDGSIIGTLGGGISKEVHHYTFQPSKQIVSKCVYELYTNRDIASKDILST